MLGRPGFVGGEGGKGGSGSWDGDTLCFELGDRVHPYDYYFFNGQKRGLPDTGIREFAPGQCAAARLVGKRLRVSAFF